MIRLAQIGQQVYAKYLNIYVLLYPITYFIIQFLTKENDCNKE